jgi:hypothetical protein
MTTAVVFWVTFAIGFFGYCLFHLGAGATHYRYQQIPPPGGRGHRKPNVWASLGRGPYVRMWGSVPLPGGFRLGHSLTGRK